MQQENITIIDIYAQTPQTIQTYETKMGKIEGRNGQFYSNCWKFQYLTLNEG